MPFLRIEFLGSGIPGSAAGRDLSLIINGTFTLASGDSVVTITPEMGPDPTYLRLVRKRVNLAVAERDGSLQVTFADGDRLTVAPGQIEPWELEGESGMLVVSVAGGGLAVWDLDSAG